MRKFKNLFRELIDDESGLTTVEYAVAGSLVAGAVVLAFNNLGEEVSNEIDDLCNVINDDGTCADSSGTTTP